MDSTSAEQMLESALALTREGFSVFPVHNVTEDGSCTCKAGAKCTNTAKHPRTDNGHLDASTNEEQIRQWWSRWPNANIGISCQASNIIVVDTDPRSGGDLSLATLEQENETLPATRTVLTSFQDGIRGEHKYYRAPPGEYSLKTSAGKGIDIKYKGYVVASQSLHKSGIRYEWKDEAAPIADLPGWLFSLLKAGDKPKPERRPNAQSICDKLNLRAGQFLPPMNAKWRDGQLEGSHPIHGSTSGNSYVIDPVKNVWYCRRCDSGGGPLEELAVADGIFECSYFKPGNAGLGDHWSEIFTSLEARGYDLSCTDPEVDLSGIISTQQDGEAVNACDLISGYQEKRLKLNLSTVPPGSLVSRYIEHMKKRTDAYPEYQYTGAMFAISTLMRRNAFITFRHGTIYPNLWIMNLGASTVSRKSTAINTISSLLTDVMAGDTCLIDINAPRRCENSFSPEAFIESLSENPVQYLILDECGQLLADMQKTYMANLRDIFCTIYDNAKYERRLRAKKNQAEKTQFVIEDPYFTILSATTPDTLARHSDLLDLQSGWLLRYIYTVPTYPKEFLAFEPDDAVLNSEYDELVKEFRKIRMIFEQHTIEFCLAPDALVLYQDWQRRMETTLSAEGDEIKLSAFGRLVDIAVKMAIIHTSADPAFLETDHSVPCTVQYREMDLSIRHIEEYFLPVFAEVVDLVSHQEAKNLQDKIIGFLKRKSGKCTRSDLLRFLHRKAGDINPEINTLLESEEIQHTEARGEKGRMERWYILN